MLSHHAFPALHHPVVRKGIARRGPRFRAGLRSSAPCGASLKDTLPAQKGRSREAIPRFPFGIESAARREENMGAFSPIHWLIVFVLVSLLIPSARILERAGYSRLWCLLAFVPLVNFIALWVFAYAKWPALETARLKRVRRCGYDSLADITCRESYARKMRGIKLA